MRFNEIINSFKNKTIICVGNGSIKNKGLVIDDYDIVIRFNNFIIHGYEKDVGIKTSYIVVHGQQPITHNVDFLLSPFNRKHNCNLPIISPDKDYRKNIGRLSTGATFLNILNTFKIDTTIIGFDGFKTKHYFDKQHVYSDAHNIDEVLFINNLRYINEYSNNK